MQIFWVKKEELTYWQDIESFAPKGMVGLAIILAVEPW